MVSTRTLAVGTGIVILGAWLGASTLRAGAQAPERLGKVNFPTSCSPAVQAQFERAVALQHSFWFAESIKGFNAVAQADPSCGIAHWGAAVAFLGNPLAGPPVARGLQEGTAAVARAKAAGAKTQREQDYIAAIATFYTDADKVDHKTRAVAYEKAMEALAQKYPSDLEASIYYALALNTTLNPSDKTYANQLKAAGILEKVFAVQPEHPGVAPHLIHAHDFPPTAQTGQPPARPHGAIRFPRRACRGRSAPRPSRSTLSRAGSAPPAAATWRARKRKRPGSSRSPTRWRPRRMPTGPSRPRSRSSR